MSEGLNLFRLQKLDTVIDKTTHRLKEIEKALSDNHLVKRAEKELEQATEIAKTIRIKLKQIEDKVEAQRIKRKTDQAALFSGRIKNPKELQDLQMETEALKKYIAQLEDEQLDIMIEYEEAERIRNQAEKQFAQAKSKAVEDNAALSGEKMKLESNLEKNTREKQAVIQSISPQSFHLYSELRKSKRGIAIATITDGCCSICGQSMTPADLQSIRSSSQLVFCPSCGRIVFDG
jgi:predicted  nucleic acid-binding Zn-ribbon protein